MAKRIGRREALGALGGVSLGALLAACGGGGGDRAASSRSTSTSTSTSTSGSDATTTTSGAAASGATTELFDDAATCSVTPEQTEGPFYFDVDQIRSDIREDRAGATLRLALRVRDAGPCTPIGDAVVDLWHSDADGVYSGFDDGSGETFLRGAQITNGDGIVEFTTVYPGAYEGRTVHIHAKVHLDNETALTTQLYFDDDISDSVFTQEPYASRGEREVRNGADSIFDEATVLSLRPDGDGYLGVLTFDVRT